MLRLAEGWHPSRTGSGQGRQGYLGSLWLEENSSVGAGRETARTSNTKYDGKWRFSWLKIANTEVSGAAAGRTRATAKERQSAQT